MEQLTKSGKDHSTLNSDLQIRATSIDLAIIPTPATLKQEDYRDVPYWTKREWDAFVECQKLANKNPPWNTFLMDKHGEGLSKQRYNELWADAKLAFNSLYYRRFDPMSWSKKTDLAATYFYNTITSKYPEFRLCEGNWKIHLWTTERYPDWVKNVRKSGGLQRACIYHMAFALITHLLGAAPSIVTIGQKRPVPTQQNDTKPSKKARQIKKEDIKQEISHVQLAATRISVNEPIIIDDDSDDDDSIYVSKPKAASGATSSAPTTLNDGDTSPEVATSYATRPKTLVSRPFCYTAGS